ncbi:MAG: hypothetical protein ACRC8A_11590 [Microcoleaceae cyanobacterium]
MINQRFTAIVSAICYSLIDKHCRFYQNEHHFPHNKVVHFVLGQHLRMPDYLQFPILILTLIFDIIGVLQGNRPFHHQSPQVRSQQIDLWRNSSIGFCRDLIRFYESLTVLAWQSYLVSQNLLEY